MVNIIGNPERGCWDRYVTHHPDGIFSHLYGWSEALARVYSLQVLRFAAIAGGGEDVVGILVLTVFPFPNGVTRLVSIPYTDYAGVLADSPAAAQALIDAAISEARNNNIQYIELRQQGSQNQWVDDYLSTGKLANYQAHSFKVSLGLNLPGSSDALWQQLPAKVRNQVRKARKSRCHAVVGGEELLDDFYAVFSENMRDLGSPVHERQLFSEVEEQLRTNTRVCVVYIQGTPAAAAMFFYCSDTIYNPWASSLRDFRSHCPNMLLYWTMLSYSCQTGCRRFDFGRSSPGANTCRFKLQWGATMSPLTWHVLSFTDMQWEPTCESLEHDWIRHLPINESIARGPSFRRRISL